MHILSLAGIVLLVFLVCGIYTSVKSLMQGAERIQSRWPGKRRAGSISKEPTACQAAADGANVVGERGRHCIDEVGRAFALYQEGALTKDEFEQLKRKLLSGLVEV